MRNIVVREFDPNKDCLGVEDVERRCEVGPSGKLCLFTDLLGDPICRVRHSPAFLMLVAEVGDEIVGMIRGCIKTVTCGKRISRNTKYTTNDIEPPKPLPVYTKLAYILGLRVSPSHRRMGIGLKLVKRMEEWFRESGVEYSYIATENDNYASVKLFTDKCGYSKFRTPSILVNPVFAHRLIVPKQVTIIQLNPSDAEAFYRRKFSTTEFFPRDIDSVLNNKLNLGTFLAVPRGTYSPDSWAGSDSFFSCPPESWAILSVWNSKDVFKLEVREGPRAAKLVKALCGHAHNLAKERGCGVVATEVSSREPLKLGIPHWKMLSCDEDLWCIKRLGEDYSDGSLGDWTKSPPGLSIFVDPREF
ncbi:putative N-acetyltransferase HLS1 [Citrus sinensis]|nr:putative N-acetyltransferase HLS1 [Citrus sinensis]